MADYVLDPARCADPAWWTQTIAFTAAHGRAPAA
jgi:hypothetical protein